MTWISVIQTIWQRDLEQIGQSTLLSVTQAGGPRLILDDPATGVRATLALGSDMIDPGTAQFTGLVPPRNSQSIDLAVGGRAGTLARHTFDTQADTTHAFLDGVGFVGNLVAFEQLASASGSFLVAAAAYGSGLSSYRLGPDGTPAVVAQLTDSDRVALGGITSIESLQIANRSFVLAASTREDAITLLELNSQGRLSATDSASAFDFLPIDAPTALQTVTIGETHFVVAASFGTGSLTVLEVTADGQLDFVDQLNDTRDTRFAGASALDIATYDGRTYVAAAGNDMGLSLFQMLPDGRLLHLATLVDQLDTALDGISELCFSQSAAGLELFVLSTRDAGLTRLGIETGTTGLTGAVSVGSDAQDILSGRAGGAAVYGKGGDDILLDTAGVRHFFGGAGADTFVFDGDKETETIHDFNAAEDRIDLSSRGLVYSAADLSFTQTSGGFRVRMDDTQLLVNATEATVLTREALISSFDFAADRINLTERAPLNGTAGNDTFLWQAGDDTVNGGAGMDRIDYSAAPQAVIVDLADSTCNALAAQGDILTGIEAVTGTQGDDELYGDQNANTLAGGGGRDLLSGAGGSDWLMPGDGAGHVDGGTGTDMLSLSDLGQSARVSLAEGTLTSAGARVSLEALENVTGTIHADVIEGDAGANRLRGLGDYDWFIATAGADTYDGGSGRDMVSYVYAPDAVRVNLGTGEGLAGLAAGDSYTSIERITGSIYNDMIFGAAGDEDMRGAGGYDWFIGSPGRDRFDGGSGIDTVAYWSSPVGVTANLSRGFGSGGDAARDLYTSIENLTGSSFDDFFIGDNGRNLLRGLGGDDELLGYGNVDKLEGGAGNDTLDGGWGWDVAIFSGARDDYTITRRPDGQTIVADRTAGRDGTDTLDNIEALGFSDGLFYD